MLPSTSGSAVNVNAVVLPLPVNSSVTASALPIICTKVDICKRSLVVAPLTSTTVVPLFAV